MGNSNQSEESLPIRVFKIVLDDEDIAFSSARPIKGVVEVECDESVQAYGIEIALIQNDYSHSTTESHEENRKVTHNWTGDQNQIIVK